MSDCVAIIGGSGIGNILAEHISQSEKLKIDTPFGCPSDDIISGKIGQNKVLFLNRHGSGHRFSPSAVPYSANIFALKKAGACSVIATGAVGSLSEDIHPGQLVLVDQFIDKTFKRKSSFFESTAAVHCEFSHPCCERLREKLIYSGKNIKCDLHKSGVYVCMEGPQFSTKAESNMHRQWGGELIGMTAMPEAKLSREAQMCYCLIAMPSDYDCWKPHPKGKPENSLLEEIIGNLNRCSSNAIELILKALNISNEFCDKNCQCRKSLKYAVWSDEKVIDQDKMSQLQILFK